METLRSFISGLFNPALCFICEEVETNENDVFTGKRFIKACSYCYKNYVEENLLGVTIRPAAADRYIHLMKYAGEV